MASRQTRSCGCSDEWDDHVAARMKALGKLPATLNTAEFGWLGPRCPPDLCPTVSSRRPRYCSRTYIQHWPCDGRACARARPADVDGPQCRCRARSGSRLLCARGGDRFFLLPKTRREEFERRHIPQRCRILGRVTLNGSRCGAHRLLCTTSACRPAVRQLGIEFEDSVDFAHWGRFSRNSDDNIRRFSNGADTSDF
ncbi:hypothetical protein R69746_03071 [Paraburkholderia aspalathi]|nr:hypothetical protein R69746_03071 [Paraburkholderia aspalathi]